MKKRMKILSAILLVLLVVFVSVLLHSLFKNFFHNIFAPIEHHFWQKGQKTGSLFYGFFHYRIIARENQILLQDNSVLLQKINGLREIARENELLRQALDLRKREGFDLILSQVLSKEMGGDVILIDKGQADGLVKDMPVITSSGILVGKVKSVLNNFSEVLLITAKNFAFDVKVQLDDLKETIALAKGQGELKLVLDFADKQQEIKEGNPVFTVALAGNFPKGLLVGTMESVQKNPAELFQTGIIKPYFPDFLSKGVLVIKNFQAINQSQQPR